MSDNTRSDMIESKSNQVTNWTERFSCNIEYNLIAKIVLYDITRHGARW